MKRPITDLPNDPENFDTSDTPVQAYLKDIAQTGMWELAAVVHDLDVMKLREQDPVFAKLERQALAKFQQKFAQHAYDIAMNGAIEDIVYKGEVTGQRRKHDPATMIRILETLVPQFQKVDRKEVTTKSEDATDVRSALEAMTDDELALVREKLEAAQRRLNND